MVCSEESCGSSGFRSSQQFRSSRGGLQLRSRAGVRGPPPFLEVQADPRPIIFETLHNVEHRNSAYTDSPKLPEKSGSPGLSGVNL